MNNDVSKLIDELSEMILIYISKNKDKEFTYRSEI